MLLEAALERRRANGTVAAEARRRGEMRKWWRGTVMAGARAWRRSSDDMGFGWQPGRRRGVAGRSVSCPSHTMPRAVGTVDSIVTVEMAPSVNSNALEWPRVHITVFIIYLLY